MTRSPPNPAFPPHPHADMEIITYVREGAITHQDLLGNKGRTGAGDVQVMSAGTGVRHAEYNLESEQTRIFQIWIEPTHAAARRLGRQAVPQGRSVRQVRDAGLAVSQADEDALPIRTDRARARDHVKAGETRRIRPRPRRATPIWCRGRSGGSQRRPRQRARRRGDQRREPTHDHRAGRRRTRAGRRSMRRRAWQKQQRHTRA